MSEAEYRRRLEQVGEDLHRATTEWTARRRRRRRTIVAACSAVATLGLAVVAGVDLGSRGTEPAAAQVLQRAAEASPARHKARRGKYLYTSTLVSKKRRVGPPGSEELVTTTQLSELWAGGDGSGRQVVYSAEEAKAPAEAPAEPQPVESPGTSPTAPAPSAPSAPSDQPTTDKPSPRKRKLPRSGARVKRYKKGTIGAGELGSVNTQLRDGILAQFGVSARELVKLSSDQQEFDRVLLARVRTVAGHLEPSRESDQAAVDREAFSLVASLLGQWGEPMPPRLGAALYRFAATLEGIAVGESFTDSQGRKGVVVRLGDASLALDPTSYQLLATSYRRGDTETTIETIRTGVVNGPKSRPR